MTTTKSYHHGDLRAALLAAARIRLERDGYETLSLRAVARDLGVASSAPYAHFDNREALFRALIDEGGLELGAIFAAIAASQASADDKLALAGRAYLAFAASQPELLRLLFVAPLASTHESPAGAQLIEIFETLVAAVMASDDEQAIRDTAIGCWSTLHGFAMLRLHKRLAPAIDAGRAAEKVINAAVRSARTA